MALSNLTPITRKEKFLDKIAGETVAISPISRKERFLNAIAAGKAGETPNAPTPITRTEFFLKKISESFTNGSEPVASGTFTVSGATTTAAVAKSFTVEPESAPSTVLVIIQAVEPTEGQILYCTGVVLVKTLSNNTALPRVAAVMDSSNSSTNNNSGMYLGQCGIADGILTIPIYVKKGSSTLTNVDGTYKYEAYLM